MKKSRLSTTEWISVHKIAAVLASLLGASLLTVLVLNFAPPEKRIQQVIVHRYGVADPQFRHEIGTLLGPPILEGNRITNLENGEEIFPAMLEAIRGAQHSITFETYIYWSGDIGDTVCRCAVREGPRWGQGARAAGLARQPADR